MRPLFSIFFVRLNITCTEKGLNCEELHVNAILNFFGGEPHPTNIKIDKIQIREHGNRKDELPF